MSWDGKVYVTASNPWPGQLRNIEGFIPVSGTQPTYPDNGLGVNTYIAGGPGPSGSIPVTISGSVPVMMSGTQGVYIQDNTGNPILVSSDGQLALGVSDEGLFNVLERILKELQRINMQLASMTGEEIENKELD